MIKSTIVEQNFDESTKFVVSMDNNHILMVGCIDSFEKHVDYYTINISQITGLLDKTYDNLVKHLIACRYSLDKELSIWRKKDENPTEYLEHENFVNDVKEYSKLLLSK